MSDPETNWTLQQYHDGQDALSYVLKKKKVPEEIESYILKFTPLPPRVAALLDIYDINVPDIRDFKEVPSCYQEFQWDDDEPYQFFEHQGDVYQVLTDDENRAITKDTMETHLSFFPCEVVARHLNANFSHDTACELVELLGQSFENPNEFFNFLLRLVGRNYESLVDDCCGQLYHLLCGYDEYYKYSCYDHPDVGALHVYQIA